MANSKGVAVSYRRLVAEIGTLYEGARKALVEAYWKIGQRIVRVEQQDAVKAAYGTGLLAQLSEDLTRQFGPGFSVESLRRMRLFYLYNPKSSAPSKLNWSQYSELLPLEDPAIRAKLEKRVLEEGLTHKALRQLVRHELVREQVAENLNAVHNTPSAVHSLELLTPPKDLTLRTYKKAALVSQEDAVLDCGFYVYHTAKPEELKTVTVTDKPAYAYPAVVERVVDGDTLVLVIDLGFGTQVREKIRLRGIDCPELGSPEGEAAKRFVMKLLPAGTEVILRSSKSDKYGRFVGDVFPNDREGKQIYLNNHLLENGYAVRLEE